MYFHSLLILKHFYQGNSQKENLRHNSKDPKKYEPQGSYQRDIKTKWKLERALTDHDWADKYLVCKMWEKCSIPGL